MMLVKYSPDMCLNGDVPECLTLVAYARLDIKSTQWEQSFLQFLTTWFTTFIIIVAAIMFQNDTDNIIISPISRMVFIIKTLADDPLQKPEAPNLEPQN